MPERNLRLALAAAVITAVLIGGTAFAAPAAPSAPPTPSAQSPQQGAPAQGAPGNSPGGIPGCGQGGASSLIMIVLMFGIFYFMLIRPQQKRAKEHREMLANIKKGDEVVTQGGLIGRVSGLTEREITLELQEKVRVRVLRSHIAGKTSAPPPAPEPK